MAKPKKKRITKRLKSKPKKLKKNKAVRRGRVLAKKIKNKNKKIKTVKQRRITKKVKPARKKKIIAHRAAPKTEFPAQSLFKAKIKVIGIGGGGGSIVSEMGKSLGKATFVIADTDIRALKKKSGIKYFWFGEDLTHGLGTGVNVELAKKAAESAKEKISGVFKDQDIIIFVASLGGGLGSGATQIFAQAAKEFGGITFGIFTMPFKFEGKNKYRIAQNALKSLRQSLNVSLVIPNERIFKIIDSSTPITDAFSMVNRNLIESLESLIDLIYNPGVINIDFADVRTILKGAGNLAFLNTAEEFGKNRSEKICENIFKNILLQNNGLKAEKILFNISGGENLSMFEVEKISSHIAKLNPKAKIIFGISKNYKLKSKIKTTILMTGGSPKPKIEEKDLAPKKVLPEEPVKKPEGIKTAEPRKIKKSAKKNTPKKLPAPKVSPAPDQKESLTINRNPLDVPVLAQKSLEIVQVANRNAEIYSSKKTIRRSGLEIKKAEELQEKKKIAQEEEWEIPAFLRKVKFTK